MACTKVRLSGRLSRSLVWVVLLLGTACLQAQTREAVGAEDSRYVEGVHYKLLQLPVESPNPDKIEVMELFSYGCIHCFRLKPWLDEWTSQLPDDILFRRTPAVFGNELWAHYARTYYALEELDILDKTHRPFFDALHKRRVNLKTPERVADFLTRFGIEKQAFLDAYDSFSVHSRMSQGQARSALYGAFGVPTLVIAGKYRIQNHRLKGALDMFALANFLIRQERKSRLN